MGILGSGLKSSKIPRVFFKGAKLAGLKPTIKSTTKTAKVISKMGNLGFNAAKVGIAGAAVLGAGTMGVAGYRAYKKRKRVTGKSKVK